MVIRTSELTVIDKSIPEYCVVISDTEKGWRKQVGQPQESRHACLDKAEWIRGLFSTIERERYDISVLTVRN